MKVKFAHVSDCHLGAWRKDALNGIGFKAYNIMIENIIEENVDFVIISGDLFDVSNPKVDVVDIAIKGLKKLKDSEIPVYGIMGSHDYSPSDKSMIRPLISAGLFTDLFKGEVSEENKIILHFTEDPKTSIKIFGMRARRRSLEISEYLILDKNILEKEEGNKFFVLHTMLSELKPADYKDMQSGPKSMLPRNFLYYAGGHLHKTIPERLREGKIIIKNDSNLEKKVIYPGVLYPTDFLEFEKFENGGFCIVSGEIPNGDLTVNYVPLKINPVLKFPINAKNKTISNVKDMVEEVISKEDFQDKIVLVRIYGELSSGKTYEIRANEIVEKIKEKGAYEVLVSKTQLSSKEYKKVSIDPGKTNKEIEDQLIHEHAQKSKIYGLSREKLEQKIHQLLEELGKEPEVGVVKKEFHENILKTFYNILEINFEEEG